MSEARDVSLVFGDAAEKARLDHLLATLPSARAYLTAGVEAAEAKAVPTILAGLYGSTAEEIDRTIATVTGGIDAEGAAEGATADEAFCMVTGMRCTLRFAREAYLATRKAQEGLALINAGIACLGDSLGRMQAATARPGLAGCNGRRTARARAAAAPTRPGRSEDLSAAPGGHRTADGPAAAAGGLRRIVRAASTIGRRSARRLEGGRGCGDDGGGAKLAAEPMEVAPAYVAPSRVEISDARGAFHPPHVATEDNPRGDRSENLKLPKLQLSAKCGGAHR